MTDKRGGWETSVGDEIEEYLWAGRLPCEDEFYYDVDTHLSEEDMKAYCVTASSEDGVIAVSEQLRMLLGYFMCSAFPRVP